MASRGTTTTTGTTRFGFHQLDYEVIQHMPILRETWVISLHGLAQTTWRKGDQQVPFYHAAVARRRIESARLLELALPRSNSVLLQGEWRIMANRFFDTAVFYDAGQVAAHKSDLDLNQLKTDYGFGVRFHAPFATVLRVDVAQKPRRHVSGVCDVTGLLRALPCARNCSSWFR